MIVYDGVKIFSFIVLSILIIIHLLFSIIRRIADARKKREEHINEKLQEKYDKEVSEISNITVEEAIKTLKENCCAMCAYGSQNMDSCDIRSCDNRDAINAIDKAIIIEKQSIPYLMHKEMNIPLLECQKAYNVAIEYLRNKAKIKG